MRFFICPMTDEQREYCDEVDMFTSPKGDKFNYEVEFLPEDEMVRITDSIGRMVPFDTTDLGSLIFMLSRINNYVKNKETMDNFLYNTLTQGADSY